MESECEVATSDEEVDDSVSSNSSKTDGDRSRVLGSKRTGRFITVASITPIRRDSVNSTPLIHSVVIYPRGVGV